MSDSGPSSRANNAKLSTDATNTSRGYVFGSHPVRLTSNVGASPSYSSAPSTLKTYVFGEHPAVSASRFTESTQPITTHNSMTPPPPNTELLANQTAKSGYVVIFNQHEFLTQEHRRRVGSNKDEEALCRVMTYFGFETIVKRDLRVNDINTEAEHLQNKDFTNYECCVIVVMSHGDLNEQICAADAPFNLQAMLVDRVAMNNSLKNKAKIFIVTACKGPAAVPQTDSTLANSPQPYMRDTLKLYSTYEGYSSYRNERGTFFVQELCSSLMDHGDTMNIEDIMKKVIIALTNGPWPQQIPCMTSTMTFNICFGHLRRKYVNN